MVSMFAERICNVQYERLELLCDTAKHTIPSATKHQFTLEDATRLVVVIAARMKASGKM